MTRYRDQTPEERKAYFRAANERSRRKKGVPARDTSRQRPSVSAIKTGNYMAKVREPDGSTTYLLTWPTQEEALQACRLYIETGTKPAPRKRGAKLGEPQKNPRQAAGAFPPEILTDHQAAPLPTAERLARIAAKRATMPATVPLATSAPIQASGEAPRANSADKPRVTWRELAARYPRHSAER